MNTGRSLRGFQGVLARRGSQIAAVALGALLVASAVAIVKPRAYTAQAVLRVTASESLASDQLAERVESLTLDIGTPEALARLAAELPGSGLEPEQLAAGLEAGAASPEPGVWDVTISHTAGDPSLATRVVDLLTAEYQDAATRRPVLEKEREIASLAKRAEAAREQLAARTVELERFVHENQRYLGGADERLAAVRAQIQTIEIEEIPAARREIERLAALLDEEPETVSVTVEERDEERISELRGEIRVTQDELTALIDLEGRSSSDSDVIAKRRRLMDLRDELARAQTTVTRRTVDQPNEMFQSLLKARVDADADLARVQRKLSVLRKNEADLLDDVRRAPDVRVAHDRLRAAVADAEAESDARNAALEEASQQLATMRQERPLEMTVIAPAAEPDSPSGGGALVIAGAGLALGAVLGMLLACVADARDHAFREPTAVSSALGLPTLGAVSVIRTPEDDARRAGEAKRSTALLVALGLAACGLLAFAAFGDTSGVQELVRSVLP